MRRRRFLPLAVGALVALGGAWALLGHGGTDSGKPTSVSEHPTAFPESIRTVTVALTMPMPSAHEHRLSAMLEEGRMLERPMLAMF